MKKYNINKYMIMYLLGYSFFISFIFNQILYSYHSLSLILIFIIAIALSPIIVFLVYKYIQKEKMFNAKTHFIFLLITFLYLFIQSVLVISFISTMLNYYYYPNIPTSIITIILLIPLLYISLNKTKLYYNLTYFILIIYLIFQVIYALNIASFDIYPIIHVFKIDNYFQIILLAVTVVLEPIILIANTSSVDRSKKMTPKYIISISIILSIINICILLRHTMEFGLLLGYINYPYIESYKLLNFEGFNYLEYMYLFVIIILMLSRISLIFSILKDQIKLNKKSIIVLFVILFLATFYLNQQLDFYRNILIPILIITSILTIIMFTIFLFAKRSDTSAV